jgi:hypothetical protein
VTAGGREQIAEVHRGQGYQSQYGDRLHFGLGEAEKASRIEVQWLGGGVDVIDDPPGAPFVVIEEGGICQPFRQNSGQKPATEPSLCD